MMIISVSAVLAGAVCGDHISPISDTTVMSSAGAQSNHLNHVSTQMQYAAVTACVCLVGYLIAAVTRTWWITLGVSLLLLLGVLTGMRRFCAKKAENGKNKKKTEKRVKCLTGEKKNRILKNRTNIHRTTVSCKEEAERFWSRNVNWNRRNWIFQSPVPSVYLC